MPVDRRTAAPWSSLPSARVPADIAPANLVLFGAVHAYALEGGDLPAIAGLTYDGARHLIPLFDLRDQPPEALLARLAGRDCYFPVPEEWLAGLEPGRFAVTHNEADSDYLYAAAGMRALAGSGRRDRRNQALRFEQDRAPTTCEIGDDLAGAAEVLDGWLADVGKDRGETDWAEAHAALERWAELGLVGRVVRTAAGEPAGFVLASVLDDCAIVHFAKGRRRLDGVYPWMFRDFARSRPELAWLNFEQDLGNPGFRRNKRGFAPDAFVHKYRVVPLG